MLINIVIIFFSIIIFYELFLAYFKKINIEGMMAVVGPVITPKEKNTNTYYENIKITQDFDPDSVSTFYS
jgi:hypothetical protein